MTSQIVLMNGFGIAIASDSASTLGERRRTYETAEKIIPLESPHRLAVMIAGNSQIGNLPFSLVIGEWTRQLGNKALRSTKSYVEHFVDWIESSANMLASDTERTQVLRFTEARLDNMAEVANQIRNDEPSFELSDLVKNWTDEVREYSRLKGLTEADAYNLMTSFRQTIDEQIDHFVSDLMGPEFDRELLYTYFAAFYSSTWMKNSTLVFAGFGEKELLPSFLQVDISGFAHRRLTYRVAEEVSLTADTYPLWGICLPAQRDTIDQYLLGYDGALLSEFVDVSLTKLGEFCERTIDVLELDPENAATVRRLLGEAQAELDNELVETRNGYTENNYLRYLRHTASSLSPADLVDVARSLIELQALRQTTTGQINTVGGPIDVALISPLTGFEWVQHKTISRHPK